MSERHLVRKDDKDPVKFKTDIVQWVRCGQKCDPQNYKTSAQGHLKGCKKSHHKRCH